MAVPLHPVHPPILVTCHLPIRHPPIKEVRELTVNTCMIRTNTVDTRRMFFHLQAWPWLKINRPTLLVFLRQSTVIRPLTRASAPCRPRIINNLTSRNRSLSPTRTPDTCNNSPIAMVGLPVCLQLTVRLLIHTTGFTRRVSLQITANSTCIARCRQGSRLIRAKARMVLSLRGMAATPWPMAIHPEHRRLPHSARATRTLVSEVAAMSDSMVAARHPRVEEGLPLQTCSLRL